MSGKARSLAHGTTDVNRIVGRAGRQSPERP